MTTCRSGVEVVLSAMPVQLPALKWNTHLTWSRNRSYVRELPPGIDNQILANHNSNVSIEARVAGCMADMYGRGFQRSAEGRIIYIAGKRLMVFSSGTTGQALLQHHKVSGGAIINPELILPASFEAEVLKTVGPAPTAAKPNTARHKWVTDAFFRYGLAADGPLVSAIWYSDPDATAHRLACSQGGYPDRGRGTGPYPAGAGNQEPGQRL